MRTASRGGGRYKFRNEKLINERIARWKNGDRMTLWNEAILSKGAEKARETSSQNKKKRWKEQRHYVNEAFLEKLQKTQTDLHFPMRKTKQIFILYILRKRADSTGY